MKRWIRILLKLILVFSAMSIVIYIFMPSTLSIKESTRLHCGQRMAFEKYSAPHYWISRSLFLSDKVSTFNVDSSNKNQPPIYWWLNKNGEKGFLQFSYSQPYNQITYNIRYTPDSEGDITFFFTNQGSYTLVSISLEVVLPDAFWQKVGAYLSYYFIKKDIRHILKSAALDCKVEKNKIAYTVKEGRIGNNTAFIQKATLKNKRWQESFTALKQLETTIPPSQIAGKPYIQLTAPPTSDTGSAYLGIPVTKGAMQRIPNAVLSSLPRSKTLFVVFSTYTDDIDDIYNQLLYEAKKRKMVISGAPIIMVDFERKKATIHLPVEQ